ncbi:MAG: alginate export family protein [Bryobacteraceae bacterium]
MPGALPAQVPRPAYLDQRSDENWRFLSDSSRRSDVWDSWKYIPLKKSGDSYITLGGDVRIRWDYFRDASFGSVPDSPHGFLLQRYLVHADTHLGQHVRFFTQFQSGIETGRVTGPRITDQDSAEVHQAFFDLSTNGNPNRGVSLRVGRQEYEFGSGHFISASEVFNVRRMFDGFRLAYHSGSWTLLAIAAKPAVTNPGAFDDVPDHQQTLWGAGAYGPNRYFKGANLSIYYIGLDRKSVRLDQGAGRDQRHTFGSRTWGTRWGWDYNYELVFQLGKFGSGDIRGLGAATDTGYTFAKSKYTPRGGVRFNVTSGDKDRNDPTTQTFNPLFPGTAYSGKIGLLGPSNLIDLTPTLRMRLSSRLYFLPESSFFWRTSLNDGIYGPTGTLSRTGALSRARFVGNQLTLPLQYSVDRHLTVTAFYSHFFAGRFLRESPPGRSVNYVSAFITYRF